MYNLQSGEYTINIIDTNIEIEGIKGKNLTTCTFDTSKDDMVPPTLTFLRFIDSSDNVTNIFDKPDEIVGQFSIQDPSYDVSNGQYVFLPIKQVSVEISPNAKDAWSKIEDLEKIDEYSDESYGDFYSFKINQDLPASPNGWFDLRITISDLAGNTQTQTLSPAVKICNSTSSILDIKSEDNKSIYYNLQGMSISNNTSGICIVKNGNSVKKMLIK